MRNARTRRLGCIGLAGLGPHGIENGGAPIEVDTPLATAMAENGVYVVSVPDTGIVDAVLPDPREEPSAATRAIASASAPDPVQNNVEALAPLSKSPI